MQTEDCFPDVEETSVPFFSQSMERNLVSSPFISCEEEGRKKDRRSPPPPRFGSDNQTYLTEGTEGTEDTEGTEGTEDTDTDEIHRFSVHCSCPQTTHSMFHNCLIKYLNCPRIILGLNFGTTVQTIPLRVNNVGVGPNAQRQMSPFLIGICGGTASGKTTVCQRIIQELGEADIPEQKRKVVVISQDSFYRNLNEDEKLQAESGKFNFDSPDALDYQLMTKTVENIVRGEMVKIPVYNYKTNSRMNGCFETVYPADVVLFEGILVFHFKTILDSFHMKVFVDTDSDIRLSRRILRDVENRGRDFEHVIKQYIRTVKPAFEEYCGPTKRYADIIIPGGDNKWGITLIVQHIKELISARDGRVIEKKVVDSKENDTAQNGITVSGTTNTNGHVNGTFKVNRSNGLH